MMFHAWTGLATVPVLCLTFLLVSVIRRGPSDGRHDAISSSKDRSSVSDGDIEDLIDRLRRSSAEDESGARLQFIRLKYPWMVRHRFQPNYVTNGHRVRCRTNQSGDLIRDHYVDAVKVFVHVPRTSGTSLVECIGRLRNSSSPMAPKVTEDYRWSSWDRSSNAIRNKYDFHAGSAAFGICDAIHLRPCSYFTIFRDPFEQAVSSYGHCRTSLGDPQCNVVNANRVDLKRWILLHGGQLFRKFLFNSQICDRSIEDIAGDSVMHDEDIMSSGRESCWFKHKVWASAIAEDERRILLDYVVENLERYFAVVGLYEDMDAMLETLEFVYGLPFSVCRGKGRPTPRDSEVRSGVNNSTSRNSSRRCRFSLEPGQEEDLRNDVMVQKALKDDLRIYRRAREIVSHQNRRMFNRLKLLI